MPFISAQAPNLQHQRPLVDLWQETQARHIHVMPFLPGKKRLLCPSPYISLYLYILSECVSSSGQDGRKSLQAHHRGNLRSMPQISTGTGWAWVININNIRDSVFLVGANHEIQLSKMAKMVSAQAPNLHRTDLQHRSPAFQDVPASR